MVKDNNKNEQPEKEQAQEKSMDQEELEEKLEENSEKLAEEREEIEAEEEDNQDNQENEEERDFEDVVVNELLEERLNLLEEKMEIMEEEKDGYYKQAQRLKADFANYRKRARKEKERIRVEAQLELVSELLPVIDNFERALQTGNDGDEFEKGVQMIHKQLCNTLRQQGLEVIETEDQEFDHKYHEAVMQVEDTDEDSGMIVEEVQKGYMFKDKVVRPARVKVAK